MSLSFASGTPQRVREHIKEFLDLPSIDPPVRDAAERLAADDAMIGFWRKVPSGKEAAIAQAAVLSFERAIRLPKTSPQARVAEVTPDFSFFGMAYDARSLREALTQNERLMRARWDLWPGNQDITFDRLLAMVADAALFAERLEIEAREIDKRLDLPKPPRKLASKTASRVYFAQAMKHFLRRLCGQPHAEIVATLEQVMFDLPDAVDESTVRKR
jgi:hypothetical protein